MDTRMMWRVSREGNLEWVARTEFINSEGVDDVTEVVAVSFDRETANQMVCTWLRGSMGPVGPMGMTGRGA